MSQKLSIKDTIRLFVNAPKAEKGFMILLLVTIFPLTYKIISPILIITGFGSYTEYISTALYIIGIWLALPIICRRISMADFFVYILFALFLVFSKYLYPQSAGFVNENMHDILLYFVPFYFLGVMSDYRSDGFLFRLVMRIAFFIAVFWQICLMAGLVQFESEDGTIGEQMDFAYSLLIVVCYMLVEYNKSHDKIELCAFILGTLMLLFMGARGPVVICVMFITSYLLIFHRFTSGNIIKKIGIILVFGVFYVLSKPFMFALAVFAERMGMNTKIFDSFIGGGMISLEESSGRDSIYEGMLEAIKNDTTGFGYGIGGDRLFSASNGYAHNFEIEILVQFGCIGGGILLLLLAILFLNTYYKSKKNAAAEFWLVVFFWGFVSLQFSKSWIIHEGFFFLIGYCSSVLKTRKNVYRIKS